MEDYDKNDIKSYLIASPARYRDVETPKYPSESLSGIESADSIEEHVRYSDTKFNGKSNLQVSIKQFFNFR